MTVMTDLTCTEFVEMLGSAAPTPGGGGAASLVGAIGAGLSNMVNAITVGKPEYESVNQNVETVYAKATALQKRLLDLVERDALVFQTLFETYKLPKESGPDKVYRDIMVDERLRDCADVPLQIMRACAEVITLHEQLVDKCPISVVSDVGCGVITCTAALVSAQLTVLSNTRLIKDAEYVKFAEAEAQLLVDKYSPRADAVFAAVKKRIVES